ncbi:MAG: hypothetical protein GYA21_12170 [Myxococcales bacterium]|nr:hypothetical protein [Myxococcales bacterium]
MFTHRTDLTSLPLSREQVVAIIESINTPFVAVEGRTNQQAKAFIVGVRNPSGQFSIFIYLHLLEDRACVIWCCDPPEIPMNAYHQFEVEALQFVESMGFMVDNLHFRNLPPDQQEAMLTALPLTHTNLAAFARQSAGGEAGADGQEPLDLSPLEEGVIELQEEAAPEAPAGPVLPPEARAKLARLLGSF